MLPNQHLKKATALVLALGAIVPAIATAMPIRSDPSGAGFTLPQSPVIRIATPASGFDWGDAGIGAGAALGLMLAATGGTLLLAHRRIQSRTAS
jgi:hypothetical protein